MKRPFCVRAARGRSHARGGGGAMRTYVMQVLTGREQATIDALERMLGRGRRYELFAPRFRFQKKIRGSWQDVDELLTPGYVYVRTSMLDVDELSREIRQAPPRAAMLMQDGKIIPPFVRRGALARAPDGRAARGGTVHRRCRGRPRGDHRRPPGRARVPDQEDRPAQTACLCGRSAARPHEDDQGRG